MNPHLGPLVSSLVDEQLSPQAREKALAHLVNCGRCAEEVRDTKIARNALSNAAGTPALSEPFITGLLQMANEERQIAQKNAEITHRVAFIEHTELPKDRYCGRLNASAKGKQIAKYSAFFALGGIFAASFFLGARPSVTPPSNDVILAERLAVLRDGTHFSPVYGVQSTSEFSDSNGVDIEKLSSWLKRHGWTAPSHMPEGVTVKEVGFLASRPNELEIVLTTPVGQVVIVESRGILDVSTFDKIEILEHASGPVYQLSSSPVHLVWQSGETVIEVISQASSDRLIDLAHSFKAEELDSGYTARLARGLTQLAGVVSE